MRRKLKDTGGLTFVELLCAVCILVLLVLMMNTCLNMAVKSYRDITAESETELLVSSISDALTDKLRYCVMTETPVGYTCSIGEVGLDTNGRVTVTGSDPSDVKQLLPGGAYGENEAYIGTYEVKQVLDPADASKTLPLVTYDPAANTFTVTFTVTAAKAGISKTTEFTVRCLNPVRKEV